MPVNKSTISHQLKVVKPNKSKVGAVIHASPYLTASSSHVRSHLRSGSAQQFKSLGDPRDATLEANDTSMLKLQQCTRILRNVLANDEDKSTSTSDFSQKKENDLLFFIADQKSPLITTTPQSQDPNTNSSPGTVLCTCQVDKDINQMPESKRSGASNECTRNGTDKASLCANCHNVIPSNIFLNKDGTPNSLKKDSSVGYNFERFENDRNFKSYSQCTPNTNNDYKAPIRYNLFGDDSMDNLSARLQGKVTEIRLIARATRDADLDRLVFEIDQIFQQIIRENSLLFNHIKTIAKTLKTDNSGLKQKFKDQLEINRDLKSELKLLRQENKQKVEELKLEVHLKSEEITQLTEKDKNGMTYWNEKYHNLEKDHERLRNDYQGQVLLSCQKDTEIIQMKHLCTQMESKLKEEMHSLKLLNQTLQADLAKSQDFIKKYDQECQHNQSIIKAAREHVVQLLDRHKQNRDSNPAYGNYRFESLCDTPMNGSGDWINQATSLQKVLSIVSEGKSTVNNVSTFSDRTRYMNNSPTNFATTNFNNNYVASSTYTSNVESTKKCIDENVDPSRYNCGYVDGFEGSQCPSDVSSTISQQSLESSFAKIRDNNSKGTYILAPRERYLEGENPPTNDSWLPTLKKGKMSSASSVLSTVSSLRSTDDQEFRSGLQRLDSQITRLQSTLQSKLHCK